MEQSLLPETQETQHYEEIGTQKVETRASYAKTRGCHTQLDEGPETP